MQHELTGFVWSVPGEDRAGYLCIAEMEVRRVVAFIAFSSQRLSGTSTGTMRYSSSDRAGGKDAVASLPRPLGKHQSTGKS